MSKASRRTRPRRVHFCLPPLAPDEALRLVTLLERITHSIWDAHGAQMAALLAALPPEPDSDSSSDELVDLADNDLPF